MAFFGLLLAYSVMTNAQKIMSDVVGFLIKEKWRQIPILCWRVVFFFFGFVFIIRLCVRDIKQFSFARIINIDAFLLTKVLYSE